MKKCVAASLFAGVVFFLIGFAAGDTYAATYTQVDTQVWELDDLGNVITVNLSVPDTSWGIYNIGTLEKTYLDVNAFGVIAYGDVPAYFGVFFEDGQTYYSQTSLNNHEVGFNVFRVEEAGGVFGYLFHRANVMIAGLTNIRREPTLAFVPLPGAALLFGSALILMTLIARRNNVSKS